MILIVALLCLLSGFWFVVGCVYEGVRRGGTVDLNAEIALLRAVSVCGEATATARSGVVSACRKSTPAMKGPAHPC